MLLQFHVSKKSVKSRSHDWLIAARAYPRFHSMKWLGVFLLSLDGMPVHCRPLPAICWFPQQFAFTHLYSGVERGTVRIGYLTQEHNPMFLARVQTQTAQSGVKCSNHEATLQLQNVCI